MFTLYAELLHEYPELNPYDLEPLPYQLIPQPPRTRHDTQEFRDAALAVAEASGENPLANSYGSNPFVIQDPHRISLKEVQFAHWSQPPPMDMAALSGPIQFLEQLNPTGTTPIFKVLVGQEYRVLKVFPDRPTSMLGYRKPEEAPRHPLERFASEKAAYEHLMHYGACAKGAVPQCYGWLELSAQDVSNIVNLPGLAQDSELKRLATDAGPPKALLLEYIAGERVTIDNVTDKIAENALRTLYLVHASYVMHCDVHSRNILVTPAGRIVWVDFDRAFTPLSDTDLMQYMLFIELSHAWSYFYAGLLPDKRIGFRGNWWFM